MNRISRRGSIHVYRRHASACVSSTICLCGVKAATHYRSGTASSPSPGVASRTKRCHVAPGSPRATAWARGTNRRKNLYRTSIWACARFFNTTPTLESCMYVARKARCNPRGASNCLSETTPLVIKLFTDPRTFLPASPADTTTTSDLTYACVFSWGTYLASKTYKIASSFFKIARVFVVLVGPTISSDSILRTDQAVISSPIAGSAALSTAPWTEKEDEDEEDDDKVEVRAYPRLRLDNDDDEEEEEDGASASSIDLWWWWYWLYIFVQDIIQAASSVADKWRAASVAPAIPHESKRGESPGT